jgi:hypothetical protein
MAIIGDILTTPESGWKRFDSSNGMIVSNTAEAVDASCYGGKYYFLLNKNDLIRSDTRIKTKDCSAQAFKEGTTFPNAFI